MSKSIMELSCGHYPISFLASDWYETILLPPTITLPSVGAISPVMHLNREDLPAPLVPRITKQELFGALKEMPFTASVVSWNRPF